MGRPVSATYVRLSGRKFDDCFTMTQNASEIDLNKCEEIYTRQWKFIIESREQRELP